MRNLERNRKRRPILESKPLLALVGVFVLLFAWSVVKFWIKMRETARNEAIAAEKVRSLQERKLALEADIAKLETDRGKEEFFRENLGLAKAGEDVIVVVPDETLPPAPPRRPLARLFAAVKGWFQ